MTDRKSEARRLGATWAAAGLILVVSIALLVSRLSEDGGSSDRSLASRPAAALREGETDGESPPAGDGIPRGPSATSVPASRSLLASVPSSTAEPPAPVDSDELGALLRKLREMEAQLDGPTFFEQARSAVEQAREKLVALGPAADEALDRALRDPQASARYRGTLFFVMGASSASHHRTRLLTAVGSDPVAEARRGAIWALAAWGSGKKAKPYSIESYYRRTRFQPLPWFELELGGAELSSPLVEPLLATAEDSSLDLLTREAAVLVLGQGIETAERVLDTCMAHLGASPWYSDAMVPSWLFVASHASHPDLLERLLDLARTLLAHPDDDDQGFGLLCELVTRHPVPEVLELVLDAIRTGEGGYIYRNMLILKLGMALDPSVELEESTARAFAETFHGIAIEDTDRITRMSAILSLLRVDRSQAQALLDTALASDPDPRMRGSSAGVVPESFDPPRALELLEAAFARETDPGARIRIVQAIGRVPLAAATLALERMLPHAEGALLEALQAALARSRGR